MAEVTISLLEDALARLRLTSHTTRMSPWRFPAPMSAFSGSAVSPSCDFRPVEKNPVFAFVRVLYPDVLERMTQRLNRCLEGRLDVAPSQSQPVDVSLEVVEPRLLFLKNQIGTACASRTTRCASSSAFSLMLSASRCAAISALWRLRSCSRCSLTTASTRTRSWRRRSVSRSARS